MKSNPTSYLVYLCASFFIFTSVVLGNNEFDAYRLIQFEQAGKLLGSQSALVNFPAVHYTDNMYWNVAVVHLNDIVDGLIEKILNSKPFGVLIILPTEESKMNEGVKKLWIDVQNVLSSNYLNIPIFFSFENEENMALYKKLEQSALNNKGNTQKWK